MKKISVIIPSYNSKATIDRCVESVIACGYPSLEIILVDDCSKDESPLLLKELEKKYPQVVKVVFHEKNSGPAKGRNTGARNASGDYFFFLDSDTEMLPDALANFSKSIEKADAVTGIYYFESLNPGYTQSYKALLNYYFFSRKGVIPYEVFDASRAGIKASVFRELGGFSETLTWGMDYENEEFGYRLCKTHLNHLDPSIAVRHMFPDFWKLTSTYFFRVSLWMEIFLHRRKFESGGVTSWQTGLATIALFFSVILLPFGLWSKKARRASQFLFSMYIAGYSGFWAFVLNHQPSFLLPAIVLNIYFTVVIAAGAFHGFLKGIFGRSSAGTKMSAH